MVGVGRRDGAYLMIVGPSFGFKVGERKQRCTAAPFRLGRSGQEELAFFRPPFMDKTGAKLPLQWERLLHDDARHRRQQSLGIFVTGIAANLSRRSPLDDAATIHHGGFITDVFDNTDIVGDEQQGQLPAAA